MYLVKTALEIIVAFFSIIGIYSTWRMISQRILGDKNIIVAVEIYSKEDAQRADAIIREALDVFLVLRSQRIVILTSSALCENPSLVLAARKYGVQMRVTDT